MTAYYNEFDPKAAAWLRELIKQGHIASGDVDERSIEDVKPDDLRGYNQCHFFAGIGVWSHALRRAGWPDDRQVWTGSCPCQPFSAAGKGNGFADERHLWPAFHHLIKECRPDVIFGEQVASKDGLTWLDLVHADLEGEGYACGATDTCAAGFGAPHIRQRLYWVADAQGERSPHRGRRGLQPVAAARSGEISGLEHSEGNGRNERWAEPSGRSVAAGCCVGGMADANRQGLEGHGRFIQQHDPQGWEEPVGLRSEDSFASWMDDTKGVRRGLCNSKDIGKTNAQGYVLADTDYCSTNGQQRPAQKRACPTNGQWRDADWLFCRDGKWRPVESGTFPLAHGAPARVGRLRGYGNAIVGQCAQGFIEAYLETEYDEILS